MAGGRDGDPARRHPETGRIAEYVERANERADVVQWLAHSHEDEVQGLGRGRAMPVEDRQKLAPAPTS
jgi:hypothetical protein